jgi:uncharacterized Zn-finger protein
MQLPSSIAYQRQEAAIYGQFTSPEQYFTTLINEKSSAPQARSFVEQLAEAHGPVNYTDPSEIGLDALFNPFSFPLSPISVNSSVGGLDDSSLVDDNASMGSSFCNPSVYYQDQFFPELPSYQQPYYDTQFSNRNTNSCYSSESGILTEYLLQQQQYQNQGEHYHQEQSQGPRTLTENAAVAHPPRKKRVRRRTTPSPLQCTICLKTFSRPYNLKSHQRTHTNERPYICLYPGCGKTFARPHDLKRHDFLHSGIRPHQCSCGKRFARSDAFKRHQTVDAICGSQNMNRKRNVRCRS